MSKTPRLLVTGAAGHLGRLVIAEVLKRDPSANVSGLVRNAASASAHLPLGVTLVSGDYMQPATLDAALVGIDRLLLISSNELGARVKQHENVIDAAVRAGVKLIAYTSLLHADTSTLALAADHRATEQMLRDSGLPYVILRNGWYTENYLASVGSAVQFGAMMGSAGNGRISSATRSDYAAAAATVLVNGAPSGTTFELAGDDSYTRAQLAETIAKLSGKPIVYHDLAEADYKSALLQAGLPRELADVLSDSDACAAADALFDDRRALSRLIGHPSTPLTNAVAAALSEVAASVP